MIHSTTTTTTTNSNSNYDVEKQNKADDLSLIADTTIVALMAIFEKLGVTMDDLRDTVTASSQSPQATNTTNLHFCAFETCTFVKQEVVKETLGYSLEPPKTTTQTNTTSVGGQFVASVLRQHYTIETDWELSTNDNNATGNGNENGNATIVQSGKGATCEFVRTLPDTPASYQTPQEVSWNWAVQQIDSEAIRSHFATDSMDSYTSAASSPTILKMKIKTPLQQSDAGRTMALFQSVMKYTRAMGGCNTSIRGDQNGIYDLDQIRGVVHDHEIAAAAAAISAAAAEAADKVTVVRIPAETKYSSCAELEAIVIERAVPRQFRCPARSLSWTRTRKSPILVSA